MPLPVKILLVAQFFLESILVRLYVIADYWNNFIMNSNLHCKFPLAIEIDSMETLTCLVESNVSPFVVFSP